MAGNQLLLVRAAESILMPRTAHDPGQPTAMGSYSHGLLLGSSAQGQTGPQPSPDCCKTDKPPKRQVPWPFSVQSIWAFARSMAGQRAQGALGWIQDGQPFGWPTEPPQ